MDATERPGSVRRVFQGVIDLFKKDENPTEEVIPVQDEPKKVLGKEEIMGILPHRGTKLLLDTVTITPLKVIGEFLVTSEVCEGHSFAEGKSILKGSDLYDMSAQLLGVWAAQYPDFTGKLAFTRRYGEAKFQGPISPGDLLILEVAANDLEAEIRIRPRLRKILITGKNFSAKVNDRQKAIIGFVELVGTDAQNP